MHVGAALAASHGAQIEGDGAISAIPAGTGGTAFRGVGSVLALAAVA